MKINPSSILHCLRLWIIPIFNIVSVLYETDHWIPSTVRILRNRENVNFSNASPILDAVIKLRRVPIVTRSSVTCRTPRTNGLNGQINIFVAARVPTKHFVFTFGCPKHSPRSWSSTQFSASWHCWLCTLSPTTTKWAASRRALPPRPKPWPALNCLPTAVRNVRGAAVCSPSTETVVTRAQHCRPAMFY